MPVILPSAGPSTIVSGRGRSVPTAVPRSIEHEVRSCSAASAFKATKPSSQRRGSSLVMASQPSTSTRQVSPSPQVVQPQEGERAQLKRLFQLNQAAAADGATVEQLATNAGLVAAACSATATPVFQTLATDTFDDYEDMQGVPLMDVKRQDPRSQMPGATDSVDADDNGAWAARLGSASAQSSAPAGKVATPTPLDSTDPAWDDRVPVDASIDAHFDDIDKYGDGAAGMPGQQYGAATPPPALRKAASRISEVAAAAKATGAAAARAYARVAQSGTRVAQAAAAAMAAAQQQQGSAASPAASSWVALDDKADGTRVVVVRAGADAAAAVRQATSGLVAFEGMRHARINVAVLEDAKQLFMQLLPVMVEASEHGLHVCLTGQGAGGSLATVLALMCANHGLNTAGFSAVVFDAPPCIGEDAADEWYAGRRPDETQDEDVIDEILSRGLLSSLGMPSSSIKSVIVQQQQQANGGAKDGIVATLGSLAARVAPELGLPVSEPAQGDSTLAHWAVSLLRGLGGKQVTLFKPLGTVVALNL